MQIAAYSDCSKLDLIEEAWNRLGKQGLFFVPNFSKLRGNLEANGAEFRIVVAIDNSQIMAIACFIYVNGRQEYQIGRRKLFDLPVRVVHLFGSCVVGEPDEDITRQFFDLIIKEGNFDVISVGNIFVDSSLYKAITNLDSGFAWKGTRKEKLWWLIRLPGSFDEYMASLNERTRLHLNRDFLKCAREGMEFRVITRPEEIDGFLRDAWKISQLTYQWNLNSGLRVDETVRPKLNQLAKHGILRGYISYVHGNPCAFGWGELTNSKFLFQQTGYNPQYRKLSPGTALIMTMIRDLIENTDCEVFDFKWGGNDGYKSRLGTVSISCVGMQVAQKYRPYPLLIAAVDQMLHLTKNLVGLVVESGPVKTRLRSVLRRYGIGTF